jgi:hypothetical protein
MHKANNLLRVSNDPRQWFWERAALGPAPRPRAFGAGFDAKGPEHN